MVRASSKESLSELAKNRRGGRPSLGTDVRSMASLRKQFAESEQIKEEEEESKENSEASASSSEDDEENNEVIDDKYIEERFPGFHKVNDVEPGGSFGEIALRMHVTRQATILCEVDTEIAILSKENYQMILRQYQAEFQANKVRFVKQFSIFNCFEDLNKDLVTATYYFEEMGFRFNQEIYKEKDKVEYFYLLREGFVEISKVVALSQDPLEEERDADFADFEEELTKKRDPKATKIQSQFYGLNAVWTKKKFKENNKRLFGILKAPCFFGENEILEKKSMREHRAIAKSAVVKALVIKRERLETDFINKRSKFRKDLMKESMKKTLLTKEAKKSQVLVETMSNPIQ